MTHVPGSFGFGLVHAPVAPDVQSESELHGPPVSGRRVGSHPEQLSRMRAPAICACELQLRAAVRRATKSNISRTSMPDSSIVVVVLSNGKMLNKSLMATGPGLRSVRMPVELVSAKSVCTPSCSHIDVATRFPSGES